MADWYPRNIAARVPWHANFNVQAVATGVARGLVPAQVSQITLDSGAVAAIVNYQEAVEAFAQAVTEYKDILLSGDSTAAMPAAPTAPATFVPALGTLPGIEERTRQFAAIIKANPTYTPAVGELYGIVAAGPAPLGVPGVVAVALTASQVQLNLVKAGYELLAVDSKRGGGAWEQIGVSQTAQYIDSRAPLVAGQPEIREYRVQGMENNARVGALSDIASVVTVP